MTECLSTSCSLNGNLITLDVDYTEVYLLIRRIKTTGAMMRRCWLFVLTASTPLIRSVNVLESLLKRTLQN